MAQPSSTYVTDLSGQPLSMTALRELLYAVLERGFPFRLCCKGGSMSPFIKDGDMITIVSLDGAAPRMGDFVVFIRPSSGFVVVHRVVGKRNDEYLIQGDSISEPDGWIPRTDILGRVTEIERNGRRIRLGLGIERLAIVFTRHPGPMREIARFFWRIARPMLRW